METTLERARLILASGSPRRRELLAFFGLPFTVIPSEAEENASGSGAARVQALARLKCEEVFARYPAYPTLAADTLVCVGDRILGKPVDERDAAAMLTLLSGRWHEVHTGVCLICPGRAPIERADTTRVHFVEMKPEEIDRYIRTGEPMDKAGAYAMQGGSGLFVDRIEGSPSTVIGLPLHVAREMLFEAGIDAPLSAR